MRYWLLCHCMDVLAFKFSIIYNPHPVGREVSHISILVLRWLVQMHECWLSECWALRSQNTSHISTVECMDSVNFVCGSSDHCCLWSDHQHRHGRWAGLWLGELWLDGRVFILPRPTSTCNWDVDMRTELCNRTVVWLKTLQWHPTQSLTHTVYGMSVWVYWSLIRISDGGMFDWSNSWVWMAAMSSLLMYRTGVLVTFSFNESLCNALQCIYSENPTSETIRHSDLVSGNLYTLNHLQIAPCNNVTRLCKISFPFVESSSQCYFWYNEFSSVCYGAMIGYGNFHCRN